MGTTVENEKVEEKAEVVEAVPDATLPEVKDAQKAPETTEVKTVIPIEIVETAVEAEAVETLSEEPEVKGDIEEPEEKGSIEEPEEKSGDLRERRARLLDELASVNRQIAGRSPLADQPDDEYRRLLRKRRDDFLVRMGMKVSDVEGLNDNVVYCALEGKALSSDGPCDHCRGGCVREKELPSLLDVVLEAELQLKGEVFDSGYSAQENMFVLDIKREDGSTIEAFYTGEGKSAGWVLLSQEMVAAAALEGKDALAPPKVITMEEAEGIALKAVEGKAQGMSAALFEGFDSFAVEVSGVDGKSYDVYVGIDGAVLGYDEWSENTKEDVKGDEKAAEMSPIKTVDDLKKAIAAADQASSPDTAKALIMKRAVELGEEALIPKAWLEGKKTLDADVLEQKAVEAELELKRAFSEEQRTALAKEGIAMPDGSFPIKSVQDLENAIHAVGRAKDVEAAKAHIRKRAEALGRLDLLPDAWKTSKKTLEEDDDTIVAALMEFQLMKEQASVEDLI